MDTGMIVAIVIGVVVVVGVVAALAVRGGWFHAEGHQGDVGFKVGAGRKHDPQPKPEAVVEDAHAGKDVSAEAAGDARVTKAVAGGDISAKAGVDPASGEDESPKE